MLKLHKTPSLKTQIGCCFIINGQEFIYEGSYKEEYTGTTCGLCDKPIKSKVHLFNSVDGYNDGTYESQYVGSDCVKRIVQLGYGSK